MNITTCHWMHIKLIRMLSVLIVSSPSVFEVYLNVKQWNITEKVMCRLKWKKICILKSLKLHHCVFLKNKSVLHLFENVTVSVLMESDSFVIISSSNNSCVAFFPLIIHCVLIYILISVSLTQNCHARMIPS